MSRLFTHLLSVIKFFIILELFSLIRLIWWHGLKCIVLFTGFWLTLSYIVAPRNLPVSDFFLDIENYRFDITLMLYSLAVALVFLIRLKSKVSYLKRIALKKNKTVLQLLSINAKSTFEAWDQQFS